jgi:hypothetical protein
MMQVCVRKLSKSMNHETVPFIIQVRIKYGEPMLYGLWLELWCLTLLSTRCCTLRRAKNTPTRSFMKAGRSFAFMAEEETMSSICD